MFIYPESSAQVAVVLLLATTFMVVSEILAPFERPIDMWLYRMGHYVVFASMFLALLLRVDVSNERQQSQEVFSGVIIIAHAVMLLVVVAQGLFIFMGWDDLVEVPDSLKDPGTDADGDYERGKQGFGNKPGPGGGLGLTTNVDPLVQQEQREKRWETWERVAPTAKSSFFPTPSRRRGSGTPSRAAVQSVSPNSSIQWSEKAGTSRGCRSLSPERRSKAGLTDGVGNSSASAADTRVFAYVQAPPANGDQDGFEAAMIAAGFVVPRTQSFSPKRPKHGIQDAIDGSARAADISASSRFSKTNEILPQTETSFSRPSAEEKGDNCASPTQQPENRVRTYSSWSPRQRFRSVTMTAKATSRTAVAEKRGRKRTVAGTQDPHDTPADTVTPRGVKVSGKQSVINLMTSELGTRRAASVPTARLRIASPPGSTASSGTPAPESHTSDSNRQTLFSPAQTPNAPPIGARKHTKRTKPSRRTGGNKPSQTRVSPRTMEISAPFTPPEKDDLPPARSSPLYQRKVYIPGWRLAATEAAESGVKSSGRERQPRVTGLVVQETSARRGEQEQGETNVQRVGRASARGGQTIQTGPAISQNDEHGNAAEPLNCNTNKYEREAEKHCENAPNTRNEFKNDDGLPVGWRSVPGMATEADRARETRTRPKVRDGWAPRYPLIRPSPTM